MLQQPMKEKLHALKLQGMSDTPRMNTCAYSYFSRSVLMQAIRYLQESN